MIPVHYVVLLLIFAFGYGFSSVYLVPFMIMKHHVWYAWQINLVEAAEHWLFFTPIGHVVAYTGLMLLSVLLGFVIGVVWRLLKRNNNRH